MFELQTHVVGFGTNPSLPPTPPQYRKPISIWSYWTFTATSLLINWSYWQSLWNMFSDCVCLDMIFTVKMYYLFKYTNIIKLLHSWHSKWEGLTYKDKINVQWKSWTVNERHCSTERKTWQDKTWHVPCAWNCWLNHSILSFLTQPACIILKNK